MYQHKLIGMGDTMKKVIFGGFCLISGILLFMLMEGIAISPTYGENIPDVLIKLTGISIAIYGFVLGVTGLKDEK